ncbi:hypothetical protein TNIN_453191 [Trichonephila inaurata madagascariensis]|uniref:TAZ-type domain-containing protein n=1 Tax=Trichonephila inaurata madagascariensis TaxID=2747483 RepID=A0A8X6WR54_9ARAC|nr:hypothetical protein TNIN_453191 [Trichonephila inaurata madagascariensis]
MSVSADDVARDSILPSGFGVKIRDSLAHLHHASICNDSDCENSTCEIKKCFNHFANCLDLRICEDCNYFFDLAARHASDCETERCPTFLCENMIQIQNTNPVFQEDHQKYINLNEKLLACIKNKKVSFRKMPLEEKLPPSELVDQHNAPSTSKEACQDQDDTRRRSDRLAKKNSTTPCTQVD